MQEHEQLQKLMLQARSSVRRSSMKDETEKESIPLAELDRDTEKNQDTTIELPIRSQEKNSGEAEPTKKITLTENELFQNPISNNHKEKSPLTEEDIFRERNNHTTTQESPKGSTIHVILPNQSDADAEETTSYINDSIHEPVDLEDRPIAEETASVDEDWIAFNNRIEKRRKRKKTFTYAILLIVALLAGFSGYYLYQKNWNLRATSVAKRSAAPVSTTQQIPKNTTADSLQTPSTNANKITPTQTVDTKHKKEVAEKKESTPTSTLPVTVTKKANESTTTPNNSLGQYKVISKAYFHNEPDEATRRKAFMTHWDDAVLTPIDEKNGFVYIIFTNHLGQTSKGWLRKSDLRRVE